MGVQSLLFCLILIFNLFKFLRLPGHLMLDRTLLYGLLRYARVHFSLWLGIEYFSYKELISSIYTNGSQFCGGFRILERELQSYTGIITSGEPILEVLNGLYF